MQGNTRLFFSKGKKRLNHGKLAYRPTWIRVPNAIALEASWMRSAACNPKI